VAEKVWNQKTELSCPVEWPEPQHSIADSQNWMKGMCDTTICTGETMENPWFLVLFFPETNPITSLFEPRYEAVREARRSRSDIILGKI